MPFETTKFASLARALTQNIFQYKADEFFAAPPGYDFVIDNDGDFLFDNDGQFLIVPIP